MIKKILTLSTILSSFLFISPGYSMFSCCGDDTEVTRGEQIAATIRGDSVPQDTDRLLRSQEEERKQANVLNIQARKEEIYGAAHLIEAERSMQKAQQLRKKANKLTSQHPQEETTPQNQAYALKTGEEKSKDKLQIITYGSFTLEFPRNLNLATQDDGSKILTLGEICYIMMYEDYDAATESNRVIKGLHLARPITLRNKDSVATRMEKIYNDMTGEAEDKDKGDTQATIECIKVIVNKITPEQAPFDVKFGRDDETQRASALFKVEEKALLFQGPSVPKQQEQK